MKNSDYQQILNRALQEYESLKSRREEIDLRMTKQLAFIRATLNLLPPQQEAEFTARMEEIARKNQIRDEGLIESVRRILQRANGKFLTATQIRDFLLHFGFDFSAYRSNPLASVSTTVRRLRETDRNVESSQSEGVATVYRWVGSIPPGTPIISFTDEGPQPGTYER